jgi:hypothetical protein
MVYLIELLPRNSLLRTELETLLIRSRSRSANFFRDQLEAYMYRRFNTAVSLLAACELK